MRRVECDCGRRIAEKPSTTKSPNNKESKKS